MRLASPPTTVERLADGVSATLEGEIREGRWQAGTRLPSERRISERFGVSRAVVREALSRLKADGWVYTRQGAGAFVDDDPRGRNFRIEASSRDRLKTLTELFDLRRVVEPGAAALAALRWHEGDLAELTRCLREMDDALASGNGLSGAAADDRFHDAIAAATHSPQLQRLISVVQRALSGSRLPTWQRGVSGDSFAAQANVEHWRMFAAIRARDPDAASRAARDHLVAAAARLNLDTE